MELLTSLIILIFSAIVHEVSHGLAAEKFGDSTARDNGRITLNPIPHIDPYASILLPAALLLFNSPVIFGAARPVPVDFGNLRPRRLGMAMVSLAGPLSNFALAVICALVIKFGLANVIAYPILIQVIVINLVLGTFNLVPIPPLDGSKVIASFLPEEWMYKILSLEQYGFLLVLVFLLLGVLERILLPVLVVFSRIFGIDFGF
jgi:Zn-dependent protease